MSKATPLGRTPARKNADPPGLRESAHEHRKAALQQTIAALRELNTTERTNVLAAAAEFYGLTLTVEN